METSRGRWFLREYARRNRKADAAMVCDAVARIEQALAQRQERRRRQSLAETLAAVRTAVDGAALAAALAGLQLKEDLAPIHKATRIIKEISWRWQKIAAEARICELIDSQVAAIEERFRRIGKADASLALSAAFDSLKLRLDELDEVDDGPARGNAHARPTASTTARAAAPGIRGGSGAPFATLRPSTLGQPLGLTAAERPFAPTEDFAL
jgi:hypothetical protein